MQQQQDECNVAQPAADVARQHRRAGLAPCLFVHACVMTKLLTGITRIAPTQQFQLLAINNGCSLYALEAIHSGCNVHCEVFGINSPYRDTQGRLLDQTRPAS